MSDIVAEVLSIEGKVIKLFLKTLFHIINEHEEMAGHLDEILETISNPDVILEGSHGAKVFAKFFSGIYKGDKYIIVIC